MVYLFVIIFFEFDFKKKKGGLTLVYEEQTLEGLFNAFTM